MQLKGFLFFFLFVTSNVLGQKKFQKNFGGEKFDRALFINHTADNGYIVCGYSNSFSSSNDMYLIKLDEKGKTQWQKTFGGNYGDIGWGVVQLNDKSYLLFGSIGIDSTNDDIYVAKLDTNGNKIWEKTYGDNQTERITQMLTTADGNYVLIGQRTIEPDKNIDSYIFKIDKEGALLWQKTFGGPLIERSFYGVETPRGELLVTGLTLPHQNNKADILLLKLSKNGSMIWSKAYGDKNSHDIAHSFCLNNDKITYTLTGYIESSKPGIHDALFMQIDENGKLLNKQRHTTGRDIRLMHAEQTTDNGFIVTGYLKEDTTKNISDALLLKYDKKGKVSWLKTFGEPDKDDQGYWVVINDDGGYTLTGYTYSIGLNGDVWIIKTDENGY